MKAIEMLEITIGYAKEYRSKAIESVQRNRHMNQLEDGEVLQQRYIDAVLTDFINFIGVKHGIDLALYTSDLNK